MARSIPSYVPLMMAVTAAYLTVEVPFSSRLVEVMASSPSQEDIDQVESFGRVLTGVAVAIWLAGVFVFPLMARRGRSFLAACALAAVVGCASTWGVYVLLDMIAHGTGRHASGEERKEAFLSSLASSSIAATGAGDLSPGPHNDWKALVSLASSLSDSSKLAAISGSDAAALAREEASRRLGSLDAYREKLFEEGFERVRVAYGRYKEASDSYLEAKRTLPEQADRAWRDFQAELQRRYPNGLPGQGLQHAMLVRHVKFTMKIPVHGDWLITDRGGFVRPYMKKASAEIEQRYEDGMRSYFGERLAPGMNLDAFAARPSIQQDIRKSLGLPARGPAIVPGMSDASLDVAAYGPALDALSDRLRSAAQAPASEFSQTGEFREEGIQAVKAASLPAMAILLSIAGAALHIFKFAGYLSQFIGIAKGRGRHAFGLASAGSAFLAMAIAGNSVTGTATFGEIQGDGIYPAILTAAISIQPAFQSTAELIGSFGGWQAFASDLPSAPAARPIGAASKAVTNRLLLTLPDGGDIPIPSFRPISGA